MIKGSMSLFRKHKKISVKRCARISFIKSMVLVAVGVPFFYPFLERKISDGTAYYEVELNGIKIGAAKTEEDIWKALKDTRHVITKEAGRLVYMEPELVIDEKKKWFGTRMEQEELEEAMYAVLKDSARFSEEMAYAVKVDDNILYLSSEEEVLEVLEAVKNRIDSENKFKIELVDDVTNTFGALTTNITKPGVKANNAETVFASYDGGEVEGEGVIEEIPQEDGMLLVNFEQDVQVTQVQVPKEQMSSVADALNFLTKDNEENQIYEIVSGDCMSVIAEKNAIPLSKLYELNGGITEDTVLQIGQKLTISVPEPELSVLAKEEMTYEEPYEVETVYIDNDSWYTNEQVVRQEGSTGYHAITAVVSTRNGKEIGREVIEEKVVTEALPTIIERGTQAPPTFVWPTYGGSLTSYFGKRWGRLHGGIDIGVSTGTTVMASSSGYVVSAGWNGSYGYSILLQHSDGKQTRYAHLSKVLVSAGQTVKQGEKIALSGNTGRSTGPHLHFEIIVNGNRVNPFEYLK